MRGKIIKGKTTQNEQYNTVVSFIYFWPSIFNRQAWRLTSGIRDITTLIFVLLNC